VTKAVVRTLNSETTKAVAQASPHSDKQVTLPPPM